MINQDIIFQNRITRTNFGVDFNPENPTSNIITLNKVDYFPNYLDPKIKGNKGSNIILKLFSAQIWYEDVGYSEVPDLVMKICKTPLQKFEKVRSKRFNEEIIALRNCHDLDPLNTVNIYHYGILNILTEKGYYSSHRFYTMDYASDDLNSYLKRINPSMLDRLNLFLEICDSLQLIWKANYYHRDIKPDNILFFDGKWKIGDLGLAKNRDENV